MERWATSAEGVARSGPCSAPARTRSRIFSPNFRESATPSREVVERAIEILRGWDTRHYERTGQPRAYHLAARLQMETAARSVSVTDRIMTGSLKGANGLEVIGKGGQAHIAQVSADLYAAVAEHLENAGEPLADRRGYQAAWRRAVEAAEGRVTGTHGLRRLSTQDFYRDEYARRIADGASPAEARQIARGEAVQRLGHSRDREDQAACYLDPAA